MSGVRSGVMTMLTGARHGADLLDLNLEGESRSAVEGMIVLLCVRRWPSVQM